MNMVLGRFDLCAVNHDIEVMLLKTGVGKVLIMMILLGKAGVVSDKMSLLGKAVVSGEDSKLVGEGSCLW